MKRHARLGAVMVTIVVSAGCAGTHAGRGPDDESLSTAAAARIETPRVTLVHRFHLGDHTLVISGNAKRIVFGSRQSGDLDASSVMSLDLATGRKTRVAHSQFRRGMVNWVGASGDWTIFTDQSHTQGEGGMEVLWRVVAVNPTLNLRKVLLSNGDRPDPWVPWLGSNDDYVYWSSAEQDSKHTAREWVFHDGWTGPRTLLRHAALTPGSESVGGGAIVYLGPSAATEPGEHIGGDCWRVPISGGNPVPVTHTGLANGCATDGEWVVWYQLIRPDATPPSPEGFLDNPYELWAERLDSRKPELLHRGYMAGGWPIAQNGFAIYFSQDDRTVVQSLTDPRSKRRWPGTGWDLGTTAGTRLALPHGLGGRRGGQDVDIVEVAPGAPG